MKVVITGGTGCVGERLAQALLEDQPDAEVVLFDLRSSAPLAGARVHVGDLTRAADVDAAVRGAHLVYHIAAYGMTGAEALCGDRIRQVNVQGTQNVIDACVRQGVPRLVYVSSTHAVFDGRTRIVAGDEATTRYVTPATCSDPYSLTKAQAEQLVLAADGLPLQPPQQQQHHCPAAAHALHHDLRHRLEQQQQQQRQQGGSTPARRSGLRQRRNAASALSAKPTAAGGDGGGARSPPDSSSADTPPPGTGSITSSSSTATTPTSGGISSACASAPLSPCATLALPPGEGGGGVLRTCALRPGGIWGPGEMRHVPRIVDAARRGRLVCTFGDRRSLVDFAHVDNLVAALVLAARALGADECRAGGKAYFINDDHPVGTCELFQGIVQGLGYRWPRLHLPYRVVYLLALLMEAVAQALRWLAGGRVVWVPLISRAEAATAAVTHFTKCDRARQDLGYRPVRHSVQGVVEWYRQRGYANGGGGRGRSRAGGVAVLKVALVACLALVALLLLLSMLGAGDGALAAAWQWGTQWGRLEGFTAHGALEVVACTTSEL